MTPLPRWRWLLFCVALWLWWHTKWRWCGDLFSWCVLPEWLGAETFVSDSGKEPW